MGEIGILTEPWSLELGSWGVTCVGACVGSGLVSGDRHERLPEGPFHEADGAAYVQHGHGEADRRLGLCLQEGHGRHEGDACGKEIVIVRGSKRADWAGGDRQAGTEAHKRLN